MRKLAILSLAIVAALGVAVSAAPQASAAETTMKVGYLSCHVSSGWGIIFGSSRDLVCTYTPSSGK
jgi:hypothetical protein